MNEVKKLYKSNSDVWIAGVLAGIAEYFAIDPTVLRLGYILLLLITGVFPGVIVYIVAWFIVPEKPNDSHESIVNSHKEKQEGKEKTKQTESTDSNITPTKPFAYEQDLLPPSPFETTASPEAKPVSNGTSPELNALQIQMEEKERFMPGERQAPDVRAELAVPEEPMGELKKPNWPIVEAGKTTHHVQAPRAENITYPNDTPEMPTLDSLLDEKDVGLDDLME